MKKVLFLVIILFSISFVSGFDKSEFDFIYTPTLNTSTYNVSHADTADLATLATNSGQLEGRDTATLKTYLQGHYDLVYCKLTG